MPDQDRATALAELDRMFGEAAFAVGLARRLLADHADLPVYRVYLEEYRQTVGLEVWADDLLDAPSAVQAWADTFGAEVEHRYDDQFDHTHHTTDPVVDGVRIHVWAITDGVWAREAKAAA